MLYVYNIGVVDSNSGTGASAAATTITAFNTTTLTLTGTVIASKPFYITVDEIVMSYGTPRNTVTTNVYITPSNNTWSYTKSIVYGDNYLVTTQYQGKNTTLACLSGSPIQWSVSTPFPAGYYAWPKLLSYTEGYYMAVLLNVAPSSYTIYLGNSYVAYYSPNQGTSWISLTLPTLGSAASNTWYSLFAANSTFLLIDYNGVTGAKSTNHGTSWTTFTPPAAQFVVVGYQNLSGLGNTYLATAGVSNPKIYQSSDGTTWTLTFYNDAVHTSTLFFSNAWIAANGVFACASNGYHSGTGTQNIYWYDTGTATPGGYASPKIVAAPYGSDGGLYGNADSYAQGFYNNGRYIFFGGFYSYTGTSYPIALYTDQASSSWSGGSSWKRAQLNVPQSWKDLITAGYGQGVVYGVSDRGVYFANFYTVGNSNNFGYYSYDGINWFSGNGNDFLTAGSALSGNVWYTLSAFRLLGFSNNSIIISQNVNN